MLIISDYLRSEGQHKVQQHIDYLLPLRHYFYLLSGFPNQGEIEAYSEPETSSMQGAKSIQPKLKYYNSTGTKLEQK